LTNSKGTVAKILDDNKKVIATIDTTVNLYDDSTSSNGNHQKKKPPQTQTQTQTQHVQQQKQPQAVSDQGKILIDDIELDFNQSDFILLSSLSRSHTHDALQSLTDSNNNNNSKSNASKAPPYLKANSMLDIEHNVNPLNKLKNAKAHRRGASVSGLMQSDFQHHHTSPHLQLAAINHAAYAQTVHVLQHKENSKMDDNDHDSHHSSYVANQSPLDSPDNLHLLQQPEYVKSPTPRSLNSCTPNNNGVSHNQLLLHEHEETTMSVMTPMMAGTSTTERSMMKRRNTMITLSQKDRDELLVDGYIHQHCKQTNTAMIPDEVHACLYRFYHFECELLKFSKIYKSGDGWRFYNGNTCVKRMKAATCLNNHSEDDESSDDEQQHIKYKWILVDITPKLSGIYCWRISIRNPNKGSIVVGVCPQRMFKSDVEHNDFVYGIGLFSERQSWYPLQHQDRNKCELRMRSAHTTQCQIDMKLNCIKGEVSFCIVDDVDDDDEFAVVDEQHNEEEENERTKQEAVIYQLPAIDTINYSSGWVPYIKSYDGSVGSQIKIAICPRTWYSRYRHAIFE